jgi:hypothetical protein
LAPVFTDFGDARDIHNICKGVACLYTPWYKHVTANAEIELSVRGRKVRITIFDGWASL